MPNVSEKICEGCGARYKVERFDLTMRDKGTINCKCGEKLQSWNGAVFYSAELIKDNPPPPTAPSGRRT